LTKTPSQKLFDSDTLGRYAHVESPMYVDPNIVGRETRGRKPRVSLIN